MSDSISGVGGVSGMAARAETSNAVSIAVAAKALDQARAEGAAVNEMIRAAADVQKTAGESAGRRGGVDRYA